MADILKVEDGILEECTDKCASNVTIPGGVTKIGSLAFAYCSSLLSLEFGGTKAQWESIRKKDSWHEHVHARSVQCADGDVFL